MSDDIIKQYRQAIAEKQGISETTETPSLSVITETVKETDNLVESDDPFYDFLNTLSKAIKNKSVEEENTSVKKQNIEDTIRLAIEEATADSPIDIKIKEATLGFIEKIKGTEETTLPTSLKKYIPKTLKEVNIPKKLKQKVNLKPALKTEKPKILSQANEQIPKTKDNTYVKQLASADKQQKTLPEKVQKVANIKQLISTQVKDEIEKIKIQISKMALESGGGSVAQQFAKGGTMNGDLNVTGKYLSGGIDLSTIFSGGGGGGAADRLVSGSYSLILNSDGTVNLPDLNGSDTNWLAAPDGELLNIESSTDTPGASGYNRITLSPYGFFAYDNNSNSISFSNTDNDIIISSQDQYEWKFNSEGILVGPGGTLTVSAFDALNVILSGGKNLTEIFLTSATDAQTLSWNSSAYLLSISSGNSVSLASLSSTGGGTGRDDVNTAVITNSANWNIAYNTVTAYQSVSSSFATNSTVNSVSSLLTPLTLTNTLTGQLVTNTTFANYQTNVAESTATLLPTSIYQNASGNWQEAYNTATVYQSNSSSYATTAYTDATYLPLSGGTLTSNLSVYGNTFINNNLTIGGNLTALGTSTFANTIFTTTSALSVVNTGPGPALYVFQASGPYDVASFYDGDGIEVLHVGNAGPGGFGKVGVNESFPNEELTVRGSISATESIFATSILSGGVDLKDIFLTSETDSQTLSYNEPLAELSISNGNTVSLSALSGQKFNQSLNINDNVQFNQINTNTYLSGGINLFNILSSTGGGDPAVNTVVYTYSASWIDTTDTVRSNSASWVGGGTTEKRFDFVTAGGIDYSYSGTASQYTIETSPTWKLIRLTYANNGTISNSASAIDSWTGRLTASYS